MPPKFQMIWGGNASGDDFGHQITLLGDSVMANEDLLLTWQRNPQSPAIKEDLWMSVEARLPSQRVIKRLSERRLANYLYPTTRWRPGEVIERIPAQELLEPGLLSGYQLYITVFDPQGDLAWAGCFDTDGSALGKQSYITYQPHSIPPGVADASAAQWPQLLPGMHLKPTLLQNSIQAGQRLDINMQWYLTQLPTVGERFYLVNLVNQTTGEVMSSQPFSTDPLQQGHERSAQSGVDRANLYPDGCCAGECAAHDHGSTAICASACPSAIDYFAANACKPLTHHCLPPSKAAALWRARA